MKQKTLFSFFTTPKKKVEAEDSSAKKVVLTPKPKSSDTIEIDDDDDVEMEDVKNTHATGVSESIPKKVKAPFQPSREKENAAANTPIMKQNKRRRLIKKSSNDQSSSEDEEDMLIDGTKKKTKSVIIGSGDEEEEEWNPNTTPQAPKMSRFASPRTPAGPSSSKLFSNSKKSVSSKSAFKTPKAQMVRKATLPGSAPSSLAASTASTPANASGDPKVLPSGALGSGHHLHDTWPWLLSRRDANMKKPTDADYNPRTLYVPAAFMKNATPAMKQWWEFKAMNMDTVLFFKVGKFYELFHMDADIGFQALGLIYMKGAKAHSGFPEIAYGKMSSKLIQQGYRVARVEQTETPGMMKIRNAKSSSAKSKVVRREVCSVLTPGTNTRSFLQPKETQKKSESLLMTIKEQPVVHSKDSDENHQVTQVFQYGICLVNCSTGCIQIGQFQDNKQRDRLRTILNQYQIVEVVYERQSLESDTRRMIQYTLGTDVTLTDIASGAEFWSASTTLKELCQHALSYFQSSSISSSLDDNSSKWPEVFHEIFQPDMQGVCPAHALAVSALGGCIWTLRRSLIDQELLSMKKISMLELPQTNEVSSSVEQQSKTSPRLCTSEFVVLDGHTIQNLELLVNTHNGSTKGSVWELVNKTVTGFGRRMLREWLLKPLCQPHAINARLDAVAYLIKRPDVRQLIQDQLSNMSDVERLISRVHALGLNIKAEGHPESRAIMYESTIYNRRKIQDFLECLKGFEQGLKLVESCMALSHDDNDDGREEATLETSSPLLFRLLTKQNHHPKGRFPDVGDILTQLRASFDGECASNESLIRPEPGVDADFDHVCAQVQAIELELEQYLASQEKALGNPNLRYWGSKKEERYQLEVPERRTKNLPPGYDLMSKKKGAKRYHTPEIRTLLRRLMEAEGHQSDALADQMRRLFARFSLHEQRWLEAIECLSTLDCLLSLARVSANSEGFRRPDICDFVENPVLDIQNGKHPCVALSMTNGEFIPNDTLLCAEEGQMLVLSGPNMGGKSTLLRQTCLLVLLSQVGCFVPAEVCRFTPVDRIFTRIGASDRILAGQSTFFVELSETSAILNYASKHSLVILDELGRGTSTFDGTAIAYAVVEHLVKHTGCRTMFATHYHSLVEEYLYHPKVQLGHMNCCVDATLEQVTFLYKLTSGMCPKSHGINVARLAGLPPSVVNMAQMKSQEFESELLRVSQSSESLARSTWCRLTELMEDYRDAALGDDERADTEAKIKAIWYKLRARVGNTAAAGH